MLCVILQHLFFFWETHLLDLFVYHVGEENPAAVAAQDGHADAQGTDNQRPVDHFHRYDRMDWGLRR